MKRIMVVVAALGVGATAFAQSDAPPAPAPSLAPTPTPAIRGRAVVLATNEAEIDPSTVRSMAQLLSSTFTEKGITVVEAPELQSPITLDKDFSTKVQAAAADHVYLLHVLRIGKMLVQLEERSADGQQVLYSTGLVPSGVDTANEILPRLVEAVLQHLPATENAQVTNVTNEEGGTHNKHHAILGLPGGFGNGSTGAGIELGYQFETGQFAVGATGMFIGGATYLDAYGMYFILPGSISPYVGLGAGFADLWNSTYGGSGPAVSGEAGVEFLRFNHVHLDLGIQGIFPLYNLTASSSSTYNYNTGTYSSTPGGSVYAPEGVIQARLVF